LSALTGIAGIYFLGEGGSLGTNQSYPFLEHLLYGCYSLGSYLVKLFAPANLSVYYPYPDKTDGMLPLMYYVVPVLLIAGIAWVILKFRSNRIVIFGLLFFFVNVMFVLQVLEAGKAYIADRFTYVPYFGLFFIVATGLQNLSERKNNLSFLLKSAFVIYAGVFAVISYQRCLVWKSNATLWNDNVKQYPRSTVGYDNLGVHYRILKQYDKALENYNKVLAIKPNALTYNNRGRIYFDRGQDSLALSDFNNALAMDEKHVNAHVNRALIYCRKKEYAKAHEDFARAEQLDSTFANLYDNRGLLYETEGKYQEAVNDYTKYLNLVTTNDAIYNARGLMFQRMGKLPEAVADYSKAIELLPSQPAYWSNRSQCYLVMKNTEAAKADVLKAQQLGWKFQPDYLKALGL
jgi:tetratricopeptide (TPR) repeat protein